MTSCTDSRASQADGAYCNRLPSMLPLCTRTSCGGCQPPIGCCLLPQVLVSAPGHTQLTLTLPFGVDPSLGQAHVSEDGRLLRLTLPFKPYRSMVAEVRTVWA